MGFILAEGGKDGILIPNTVLRQDIRNITSETSQLVAVYQKQAKEEKYTKLTYLTKPIQPDSAKWPDEIEVLIDMEHIEIYF